MSKKNIDIPKLEKEICSKCHGVGLIKTDYKICHVCDGKKCIQCNSTGLEVMPYIECVICDGLGTIMVTIY
jgi:DnaJ-class molecular chaperone